MFFLERACKCVRVMRAVQEGGGCGGADMWQHGLHYRTWEGSVKGFSEAPHAPSSKNAPSSQKVFAMFSCLITFFFSVSPSAEIEPGKQNASVTLYSWPRCSKTHTQGREIKNCAPPLASVKTHLVYFGTPWVPRL